MNKARWIEMGYKPLGNGEIDTLYKKFDNGNVYIAQFNEEKQEDEIGIVYLNKDQVESLLK